MEDTYSTCSEYEHSQNYKIIIMITMYTCVEFIKAILNYLYNDYISLNSSQLN